MDFFEGLKRWFESRSSGAESGGGGGNGGGDNGPIAAPAVVRDLREHYAAQRARKEVMAWLGLLVFAAGSAAFVTSDRPFWDQLPDYSVVDIFVVLSFLSSVGLGLAFVGWQLVHRSFASTMVSACGRLEAKWLARAPGEDDLRPERCESWTGNHFFPRAVVRELDAVRAERRAWQGPWLPAAAMLGAMLLWAGLAGLRLMHDWHCQYVGCASDEEGAATEQGYKRSF